MALRTIRISLWYQVPHTSCARLQELSSLCGGCEAGPVCEICLQDRAVTRYGFFMLSAHGRTEMMQHGRFLGAVFLLP